MPLECLNAININLYLCDGVVVVVAAVVVSGGDVGVCSVPHGWDMWVQNVWI